MSRILYKSKTEFHPFYKAQPIRSKGCVGISFENTGTAVLVINSAYRVQPNGVFNNNQPHPDMYDFTEYVISFDGAGTTQGIAVITFATPYDPETGSTQPGKEICQKF